MVAIFLFHAPLYC